MPTEFRCFSVARSRVGRGCIAKGDAEFFLSRFIDVQADILDADEFASLTHCCRAAISRSEEVRGSFPPLSFFLLSFFNFF